MHNSTEDESSSSVPPVRNISLYRTLYLCAARFTKSSIPRIETARPLTSRPIIRSQEPLAAEARNPRRTGWDENHGGPSLVALRVVEGQSHVIPERENARFQAVREREGEDGGARDRSYSGVRIKREGGRNSDEGAERAKGRKDGRARRDSAGC